eukprot:XP_003723796.2 PREDICTED: dynein assembly factor 3, axonemal [Strongylocentrotus purpuratus]
MLSSQFYITEGNLELYVRQLLLLHLLLEPPREMGLQEKTEFFLEIFGNTLIRQQVSDYIVSRSNELLRMVTDVDYLSQRMPAVHLSALKFKERDQMEAILKFLRNPDPRTADIAKFWQAKREKYVMPDPKPSEEKEKKESKLVEITEDEEEEEEEEEGGKEEKVEEEKVETEAESADLMPLENVEIHYLPIGSAPDLQKKSKYKKAFDVVYFSNSMVHHLTPEMSAVFSDQATIICETARYMLELNKDQCQEFVNKVTAMAKNAGCQATSPVDGFKCSTMRFTFQRKGES